MGQGPQLLHQNLGHGTGPLWENPPKDNEKGEQSNDDRRVFISAHRILAGSEVLQGTAGSFQGGVFLGRAKETQVGVHRCWVAQPVHTR